MLFNLLTRLKASQSKALSCKKSLLTVLFPQAPKIEQPALVYSGIMFIYMILDISMPEPSLMPSYSYKNRFGVNALVK